MKFIIEHTSTVLVLQILSNTAFLQTFARKQKISLKVWNMRVVFLINKFNQPCRIVEENGESW
jgi:hypothetical protein